MCASAHDDTIVKWFNTFLYNISVVPFHFISSYNRRDQSAKEALAIADVQCEWRLEINKFFVLLCRSHRWDRFKVCRGDNLRPVERVQKSSVEQRRNPGSYQRCRSRWRPKGTHQPKVKNGRYNKDSYKGQVGIIKKCIKMLKNLASDNELVPKQLQQAQISRLFILVFL